MGHNETDKKRVLYWIYCDVFIILIGLLVVSFITELLTGCSVISYAAGLATTDNLLTRFLTRVTGDNILLQIVEFCRLHFVIPNIININSIQQIAKTVGVGSLLIVWIYAELGKKEFGLTYNDILKAVYPGYHLFVLAHLLAVLMCTWMAAAGALEGAFIALLIILLECGIQWKALTVLVFSADKRKKVATDEWMNRIHSDSAIKLRSDIYCIADGISVHDGEHSQQIQACFAEALLVFAIHFQKVQPEAKKTIIWDIAYMWDRLLQNKSPNERCLILSNIFQYYVQENSSGLSLGAVCDGYVLWLCRYYEENNEPRLETVGDLLVKILKDITSVTIRLPASENVPVSHYLNTAFQVLVWMHFMCNPAHMRSDLLKFTTYRPRDGDNCLLRAFAQARFDQASCDKYFEIAYRQTFGHSDGENKGGPQIDLARETVLGGCEK